MEIKDFFNKRINEEKFEIKNNREIIASIGILCFLTGGSMVLGSFAGIFTIPLLLTVSIPGVIGLFSVNELRKSIKNSKEIINNLKNMELNGVDASRNHERYVKITEIREKRNEEVATNNKFGKALIAGIVEFVLGAFSHIAGPFAIPLMAGGYLTTVYSIYKICESNIRDKELKKRITKLEDAIKISNTNQQFIVTNDYDKTNTKNKNSSSKKKEKKYTKEEIDIADSYVEDMAKNSSNEETKTKVKQ